MRGLFLGGLLGLFLGYGFGGLAGVFGLLLQLMLAAGVIFLVMRMFANRSQTSPMPAGAGAGYGRGPGSSMPRSEAGPRSFGIPRIGSGSNRSAEHVASGEIELTQADLDTFEQRLGEVQEAFSREDHAALGRLATPEIVSYLSDELNEHARDGVQNSVSDVKLLQADIAESWREADRSYATAALRYESIDVIRDRNTGAIVSGEPGRRTETTELWTFVREGDGDWKVSAIQEAAS